VQIQVQEAAVKKRNLCILCLSILIISLGWTTPQETHPRGLGIVLPKSALVSEEVIDSVLGMCIQFRVDTLYVPAISYMEALYVSDILPRSNVLINHPTPLDFDPIGYILRKAATLGVRTVLMLDLFTAWPSEDIPFNPLHVTRRSPQWLSHDSIGQLHTAPIILDPGNPQVQSFILSLLREIMIRYQPMFIALENFQYPNRAYGYNPSALIEFERKKRESYHQVYSFDTFREQTLDDLIFRISALRDSLGVFTQFSAFVPSDIQLSRRDTFQNWAKWVNAGHLHSVALSYWYPDIQRVRYDTSQAFETLYQGRFVPVLNPFDMNALQLEVIVKEILGYPIPQIILSTFSPDILRMMNSWSVGVPR